MKRSFENYVAKAQMIHGNKYKYLKDGFENTDRITYICPKHGLRTQRKADHLQGKGCYDCRKTKTRLTIEEIISKANAIHQNKYDYSNLTEHKNSKEYMYPICHKLDRYGNEHGMFRTQLGGHLYDRNGCPKCATETKGFQVVIDKNKFIERAVEKHHGKYIYDNQLNFINSRQVVTILCLEHGYFKQNAHAHLNGEGCPLCRSSHLENEIRNFLHENKIEFEEQKRFEWLGRQSLDFYLPQYNVAIECQGIQHFQPVALFGGLKAHQATTDLDEKKRCLCKNHNLNILYYSNLGIDYPYNVFEDKQTLLKEIKK